MDQEADERQKDLIPSYLQRQEAKTAFDLYFHIKQKIQSGI